MRLTNRRKMAAMRSPKHVRIKWIRVHSWWRQGRLNGRRSHLPFAFSFIHFFFAVHHAKDFELFGRPKKTLSPNFCKECVHQNIFSQYKSKPCSFFQGVSERESSIQKWKDLFSVSFLSKIEKPGIVYIHMVAQNESALIVTHARLTVFVKLWFNGGGIW